MTGAAAISAFERDATLRELERRRFDVVVIGGGITGAGVARAAARRGLSVALIEADDFASGTSSRSSKLIHGGLRYLAQGDVGLVREAALERKHVHRLAPHLAEPRWMLLPIRSRSALLKFRAAIATYERLGAVAPADRHRSWGVADLLREEPLLDRARFPYGVAYREYLTDDARLVLAVLRGAVADGAVALNHAPARALARDGGEHRVTARCALSGAEVSVRGRSVVNAAGPWVDAVRRLEDGSAPELLQLSQGIHVVVPAARLPVRHLLLATAADRRNIFVFRRGQVVFVGTTDTGFHGAATWWPDIQVRDVEYLLEPLARYLDVEPLEPSDVVGAWAGLRPLVAQPGKAPTEVSRRDEILIGASGVVSVGGGKLTGYRPMAERALAAAAQAGGFALAEPGREAALPGGDCAQVDAIERELARAHGLEHVAAARLARLYGGEASQVAARGAGPLVQGRPVLAGEVAWALEREGAARVVDVLYRRTRAALYEPTPCGDLVEPIAAAMAAALGWDAARAGREAEAAREQLRRDVTFAADAR